MLTWFYWKYLQNPWCRCLNPYSNGMLTWLLAVLSELIPEIVLILILMECSLGDITRLLVSDKQVLILILMECSLGTQVVEGVAIMLNVLILILMECSLGSDQSGSSGCHSSVLILILMECSLGCDTSNPGSGSQ